MPSRRQRRKAATQHRHAAATTAARIVGDLELAERVERLAYTRAQAAEALGISLATLDRRVVPVIATVATEWGGRLIPVSELERYLAERTQQPRRSSKAPRRPGRKASVPPEIVARIKTEHANGSSLGEIATGSMPMVRERRRVAGSGGRPPCAPYWLDRIRPRPLKADRSRGYQRVRRKGPRAAQIAVSRRRGVTARMAARDPVARFRERHGLRRKPRW